MRVPALVLRLAAAAAAISMAGGPASVAIAAPAPALSIAGAWKGPFLSTQFVFEFTRAGNGWTGRYRSDKSNKWAALQNVSFAGDTLRFSFESQPPSTFALRVAPSGKALSGTARFGPHPPLPLTLTRAS